MLVKSGWRVYPNIHFRDRDLNTDRELDIWADKEYFLELGPTAGELLVLRFHLIIECKKIPGNAWIFFPKPVEKGLTPIFFPRMYTLLDAFDLESEDLPVHLMTPLHYRRGFPSRGYTELILREKLSNKKRDNLWEAMVSVVKATSEAKNVYLNDEGVIDVVDKLKGGQVLSWVDCGSPMSICYVFPLVVFEGKMFAAKFPLAKENLNETSYVHCQNEYKSAKYDEYARIDIVEKRFLQEYLKEINNDVDSLTKTMREHGHEVVSTISEQIVQKLRPDSLPPP
jgi:hypothetical protein